MSRLDIKTPSKAQMVVEHLYRSMEHRIEASPPADGGQHHQHPGDEAVRRRPHRKGAPERCRIRSRRSPPEKQWPSSAADPAARPPAAYGAVTSVMACLVGAGSEDPIRFSHENGEFQTLYQEFLERPLGKKPHHLLHTNHEAWEIVGSTKPDP